MNNHNLEPPKNKFSEETIQALIQLGEALRIIHRQLKSEQDIINGDTSNMQQSYEYTTHTKRKRKQRNA